MAAIELKILRAWRRVKSKVTTMNISHFSDLLGRVLWDKALTRKGAQESWLILKCHLIQAQKTSKRGNQAKMPGSLHR